MLLDIGITLRASKTYQVLVFLTLVMLSLGEEKLKGSNAGWPTPAWTSYREWKYKLDVLNSSYSPRLWNCDKGLYREREAKISMSSSTAPCYLRNYERTECQRKLWGGTRCLGRGACAQGVLPNAWGWDTLEKVTHIRRELFCVSLWYHHTVWDTPNCPANDNFHFCYLD